MDRHPSPSDLKPGVLVVVRGGGQKKWACFQCPGGCGNRFQLSLNQTRRPNWVIEHDWLGRPSVSPSIHQRDACHAHFWIRGGRITWCPDSGHQASGGT
ncbi:DUF6527 family protein [Herbaspirillum rubrisubalbicans]|nr:DUF6527 family protein [Herbaspirillum rubrisubalbicans]